jgi:hypothetical protein
VPTPPRTVVRRRPAAQNTVEADWSKGMMRDAPRDALPPSSVYNAVDFLLHKPGIAQKRGGTSYHGPAITGAAGTPIYIDTVGYAPFNSGAQVLAVGQVAGTAKLYVVSSGGVVEVGSCPITGERPKFYIDRMIFCQKDATHAPYSYNGTAVAIMGGSPPAAKLSEIYKTRFVLANGPANPNRIWFSPVPNIESTWDTANSWIDCDFSLTGLAATQNQLFAFSEAHTERIVGSTPPPGSDMDRSVVAAIGCTDARSIVAQDNNVIFANPRGVYLMPGSGYPVSLTKRGGIEAYWQSLLTSYDRASWTISAGLFRSFLIVTILNGTTHVDTLMCNLDTYAWWRISNFKALMYANALGAGEELYYADRTTNRIVKCAGIFSPGSTNTADADTAMIAPTLELRMLGSGPALKHFGHGHVTYDMLGAQGVHAPKFRVEIAPGVEATTFETASDLLSTGTSAPTTPQRERFTVGKVSQGLTVRLSALLDTLPATELELYAVELEQRPLAYVAGGE